MPSFIQMRAFKPYHTVSMEPGEGSDNIEERKKSRRDRVSSILTLRGAETTDFATQVESDSAKQIAISLAQLDKIKLLGIGTVTSTRIDNDIREAKRRVLEEKTCEERAQRLHDDSIESGKQNAEIEVCWKDLLEKVMPRELQLELQVQCKSCSDVIAKKDKLITDVQAQLREKDESYIKGLNQMSSDIDELLENMHSEFSKLRDKYNHELNAIENTFKVEQRIHVEKNNVEMSELFEKRKKDELIYMQKRRDIEIRYQKEIEDVLAKDLDDCFKLKVNLGKDIQTLEQQLEDVKATYLLNSEKLEYNCRILSERDVENNAVLSNQKRKITKLNDALTALNVKFHAVEKHQNSKHSDLIEECKSIKQNYFDLQTKYKHFQSAESTQYKSIFDIHKAEAEELANRVLLADKIIQTQQLGWIWHLPNQTISTSTKPNLPLLELIRDQDGSNLSPFALNKKESSANEVKFEKMLSLLANEAGFLADVEVQSRMNFSNCKESIEAFSESVLRNLGVKDETEKKSLVKYFSAQLETEDCNSGPDSSSSQSPAKMIHPNEVIKTLRTFIRDRKEANTMRIDHNKIGAIRQQEQKYWLEISRILGEHGEYSWKVLEEALAKYANVIKERARCIERVKSLEKENFELREMLQKHFGSNISNELIVKPLDTVGIIINRKLSK